MYQSIPIKEIAWLIFAIKINCDEKRTKKQKEAKQDRNLGRDAIIYNV